MERTMLCKGDKVKLLRCGMNVKERPARVEYANSWQFIPTVRLLGILPWVVRGNWMMSDEGKTWVRL
jgi:hypothetical protein